MVPSDSIRKLILLLSVSFLCKAIAKNILDLFLAVVNITGQSIHTCQQLWESSPSSSL